MKTERKELEIINVIVYAAMCLVMLQYLTGCSIKVGLDWHGETARDDKTYTETQAKK